MYAPDEFSRVTIYISEFTRYKKGSVGLNDFTSWCKMSLVPIIFFLAGRLCCRESAVEKMLFLRLVSRWEVMKLICFFQAYWSITISCHFWFLQDLSLMKCSLSIFFGFGSRITKFIWWICTGKNSVHSSRVRDCTLNKLFYLCYLSVQWFRIT